MFMNIDTLKNLSVGRKEIAHVCKYTNENYINELVSKGAPKNSEHNSYPLIDFIQWHIDYLKENFDREVERIKSEKPQDNLARKSAELKDLLIREKRGELGRISSFKDAWLNEMLVVNSELDGFPIKAASNLLGIDNIKDMKEKLVDEINKIKTKIAKLKLHTS